MMIKHIALAATALAALPAMASSEVNVSALEALPLVGSERLSAFALTRPGMGNQAFEAGAMIYHRMGYLGQPGEVTYKWLKFSPVLTYDTNLNGGFSSSSFTAGGIPFTIEESHVAKKGLLVGMMANGGMRMNIGDNTALDLRGYAVYAYAPEHKISKSQLGADACVRYMFTTETQAHGCLDLTYARYDLGDTKRAGGRLGVSHSFTSSFGYHDVTGEVYRHEYLGDDAYSQDAISLRTSSALKGGIALMAGVHVGSAAGDNMVMREKVDFGIGANIKDRPTYVSMSAQRNRGGLFLGEDRHEAVYNVAVSTEITQKLSATVTYSKTKANQDFFNADSVGFSLDYRF